MSKVNYRIGAGILAVVLLAGAVGLGVSARGSTEALPDLPFGASSAEKLSASSDFFGGITFVLGDGVGAPANNGPAYQLNPIDDAAAKAGLESLAAALGIDGSVTDVPAYVDESGKADPTPQAQLGWTIGDDQNQVSVNVYDGIAAYSYYRNDNFGGVGIGGGTVSEPVPTPGVEPAVDPTFGRGTTGSGSGSETTLGQVAADPVPAPPATTIVCVTTPCGTDDVAVSDECYPPPGCDGAEVCPAVCYTTPPTDYVEPTPLADLPSEEAAIDRARELFAAAGIDLEGATFKTSTDDFYGVSVTLDTLGLDGYPVAGPWGEVTFGSASEVVSFSARLAEWDRVGDYPLVDATRAVERLNNSWGGGPMPLMETGMADDPAFSGPPETTLAENLDVVTQPSEPAKTTSAAGGDDVDPTIGCTPEECVLVTPSPLVDCAESDTTISSCVPSGEPLTVTLVDARFTLVERYEYDEVLGTSTVYLVPAFAFVGDDGGEYVADAVADEYVEDPTSEDPTPQTTVPGTVPDTTFPDDQRTVPPTTVPYQGTTIPLDTTTVPSTDGDGNASTGSVGSAAP